MFDTLSPRGIGQTVLNETRNCSKEHKTVKNNMPNHTIAPTETIDVLQALTSLGRSSVGIKTCEQ